MDLQEVGGGCGDWMELAQDRDMWRALVSTVRILRVPNMRGIFWLAAEPVSFSRRTLFHGVSKYKFTLFLILYTCSAWYVGCFRFPVFVACLLAICCFLIATKKNRYSDIIFIFFNFNTQNNRYIRTSKFLKCLGKPSKPCIGGIRRKCFDFAKRWNSTPSGIFVIWTEDC
jgi:hypothetical protein